MLTFKVVYTPRFSRSAKTSKWLAAAVIARVMCQINRVYHQCFGLMRRRSPEFNKYMYPYHQKGEATRRCQAVAGTCRAVTRRLQGSYLPNPVLGYGVCLRMTEWWMSFLIQIASYSPLVDLVVPIQAGYPTFELPRLEGAQEMNVISSVTFVYLALTAQDTTTRALPLGLHIVQDKGACAQLQRARTSSV